jgi:hypothetical protein
VATPLVWNQLVNLRACTPLNASIVRAPQAVAAAAAVALTLEEEAPEVVDYAATGRALMMAQMDLAQKCAYRLQTLHKTIQARLIRPDRKAEPLASARRSLHAVCL